MTGHTPGPWSVPHFAGPDTNCECGYVLCDHLMGAVATVHCSGEGDDWQKHGDNPKFAEAVANAHLIAAAPDLLKSAVLALEAIDSILPAHKGQSEYASLKAAFGALESAVAKAEGP